MDERAWQAKSVEILTDIKAWRQAHPTATFVDIEEQVHSRLMELEAHVLQEAACASESQAWGLSSDTPAPLCPTCAVPLQARGQRVRTVQGNGGQSVTLKRTYGVCPKCGAGLFPPQGWPIGSGMVESANKLVVQARLKGPGMHWQRSHVNPLLALRLAECNDRWQEMWHQAVRQQRCIQAPQRSAHTKPGAQVMFADGRCTQTSSSSHAPAASVPRTLPIASQRRSAAPPRAPVSASPMLRACSSHQGTDPPIYPSEKMPPQPSDRCICGAPLARFKGHRTKEFCSGRCRQRAYRQRQTMKRREQWRSIVPL